MHRGPVLDSGAHVAEDAPDVVAEPVQRVGSGLPADLEMEERLGELGGLADPDETAVRVAGHPDLRVDDERDERSANVEHHADGVDQERHVVGHDVDHGNLGWPTVARGRRPDVDRGGPRLPLPRDLEMGDERPREVAGVAFEEVVHRDVRVVALGEGSDERGVCGPDRRRGPLGDGGESRGQLAVAPLAHRRRG